MNKLRSLIDRYFPPFQPIPAGMYTYNTSGETGYNYRLHLRIDADGTGLLIVNGSTVVQLNQTAAEYAYHLIQNTPADAVAREVSKRYGIKAEQAAQDFAGLSERLQTLIDTPDLDPVTYLDFERNTPYSGAVSAPYRLDCALTYRLPEEGFARFVPTDRVKHELLLPDWQTILDKAWKAGIPHVVFTGGEPTLRNDLSDLLGYASQLGMVTGLITNGLMLADNAYLTRLLNTGLDHLMIVLHPESDQSWLALKNCLAEDISVTVHLTVTADDNLLGNGLIAKLVELGVQNVSISTASPEQQSTIPAVRQALAQAGLHLVWDLPVPYSELHPVALELSGYDEEIPQGAGKAWLYVEPDGDVLPAQGVLTVLGNLLQDDWDAVWKKAAA